jgi:hypothetical protein
VNELLLLGIREKELPRDGRRAREYVKVEVVTRLAELCHVDPDWPKRILNRANDLQKERTEFDGCVAGKACEAWYETA